jgi:hypothetical protein
MYSQQQLSSAPVASQPSQALLFNSLIIRSSGQPSLSNVDISLQDFGMPILSTKGSTSSMDTTYLAGDSSTISVVASPSSSSSLETLSATQDSSTTTPQIKEPIRIETISFRVHHPLQDFGITSSSTASSLNWTIHQHPTIPSIQWATVVPEWTEGLLEVVVISVPENMLDGGKKTVVYESEKMYGDMSVRIVE